jgi:hypothetical protein
MRIALILVSAALAAAVAPSVASAAKLSPADRAAINRTLDVFVPAAIGRAHSERALPLVTKAMRVGTTTADWKIGTIPVQPFPVIGKTFHGWTVDSVGRNRADVVLLVHLKKGNDLGLGAASFDLAMKKLGGRWLVDRAVVAATFAGSDSPSKILAAADFGPGNTPDPYAKNQGLHSEISGSWIWAFPAGLLVLLVLGPLGILIYHKRRDRTTVSEERRARVFRTSE